MGKNNLNKEAINQRRIPVGEKDWCTEHGRALLSIEGEVVCPECKEAARGDEAKLQELSENWIEREPGNWKCEKHGKDLTLNVWKELICLDCIDDLVLGKASQAEIDSRWSRKDCAE